MLHGRNSRTFIRFVLSLALALPAPAFAHGTNDQPPKATDGEGVLIQKIMSPDGKRVLGNLVLVTVSPKDEGAAVKALGERAAVEPGSAMMLVSGENDPALEIAKASGLLGAITIAKAYEPEALPALKAAPANVKNKILANIKKITDFAYEKRKGLMGAFVASSIIGGLSFYGSSSVPGGLTVAAANMVWLGFLMTSQDRWGRLLERGGDTGRWIGEKVLGTFGQKLSERDKRLYELGGKFLTSTGPNAVMAAIGLYFGGQLITDTLGTALTQIAIFGAMLNYNIWDTVVDEKVQKGKLSESKREAYVWTQVFGGAVLEGSSMVGFAASQSLVAGITIAGVAYIAGQPAIEGTLIPRARVFFRNPKSACQLALISTKEALVRAPAQQPVLRNGHLWDDVQ